jgi:hypothetical protein
MVQGGSWTFSGQSGTETSIVGQQGATIGNISNPAIFSMQSGSVFMRALKLSPSTSMGISAKGGTLRLDTVTVENCMGGGILLDGAAFDIRNAAVTANGPGTLGSTTWGGILVNKASPTGPNSLNLVTVQNNMGGGVACSVPLSSTMGVLASMNTLGLDIGQTCAFPSCGSASSTCGAQ